MIDRPVAVRVAVCQTALKICTSNDNHTPRSRTPQPNVGTKNLIPVTNPLERLNKEVKRRADVVGIFPNEDSIVRLVGAVLLEQNDDWLTQNRYMQIEGMTEMASSAIDAQPLQITPKAA